MNSLKLTRALMLERIDHSYFVGIAPSDMDTTTKIGTTIKTMYFDIVDHLTVNVDVQRHIISDIKGGYFTPKEGTIKRAVTLNVLDVVRDVIHEEMTDRTNENVA